MAMRCDGIISFESIRLNVANLCCYCLKKSGMEMPYRPSSTRQYFWWMYTYTVACHEFVVALKYIYRFLPLLSAADCCRCIKCMHTAHTFLQIFSIHFLFCIENHATECYHPDEIHTPSSFCFENALPDVYARENRWNFRGKSSKAADCIMK